MIERQIEQTVERLLRLQPAVVLLGPRQVGKTTLAQDLCDRLGGRYIDLERSEARELLAEPGAFLAANADRLLVLDEVQRVPELFAELRGAIDDGRRAGRRSCQYLLLGSASFHLMRQSESLAGRASFVELVPVTVSEIEVGDIDRLWLNGGYPEAFLARSNRDSFEWRSSLVRAYVERDARDFSPRVAAESLRRLWTMLAHNTGAPLNAAYLGRALDVGAKSVTTWIDLLVDLLLVRRLPAWSGNVSKRLVKAPKVYVRDSGLLHALLSIESLDMLVTHPVVGASWEGFVIENVLNAVNDRAYASYYRTAVGAELDLVLEFHDGATWAIEIKRGNRPSLSRGFHVACDDLQPDRRFLVTAGESHDPLTKAVERIGVRGLVDLIRERTNND